MKSVNDQSFFKLTPDKILSAAEAVGKRSTGRCLPLNSYENRVHEVELEDDTLVVTKFYRPGRWSFEQIDEEHKFLRQLKNAEVPVVCPLNFADEGTLSVIKPENLYFCVYEKRGGRIRDEPSLADLERLGRTTARLHLVGKTESFKYRPNWSITELKRKTEEVLGAFLDMPEQMKKPVLEALSAFYQRASEERISTEHFRIHGDLHMGNVLWRDEELSIVDLDDSITGPAEQDCWLFLGSWDEYRDERREAFMRGYSAFLEPPLLNIQKERIFAGLRQAKFLSWYAERWHDPIFPQSFSFFVEPGFWNEQLSFFRELLN